MSKVYINKEELIVFIERELRRSLAAKPPIQGRATAMLRRQYERGVRDSIKWIEKYLQSKRIYEDKDEELYFECKEINGIKYIE